MDIAKEILIDFLDNYENTVKKYIGEYYVDAFLTNEEIEEIYQKMLTNVWLDSIIGFVR